MELRSAKYQTISLVQNMLQEMKFEQVFRKFVLR